MAHANAAQLLVLYISFIVTYLFDATNASCERHRKPWHLITDDERMQFVTGFQQLRSNGILSAFASTHHLEGIAFEDIHKTSEFFFWHSYFVWEVESQFRNLGEEYACFSMPYWDITYDATYLDADPSILTQNLPIFNSMVGGDGNPENNHCVEDELWNMDTYTTEYNCADDELSPNCCLKRQRNDVIAGIAGLANMTELTDTFTLHRFREFQDIVSLYHGKVHKFFATTNESHMWSNNAAEDPLFVLLHSFIDYIRFMRQDCWDFDKVAISKLDGYIPYAFDGYQDEATSDGSLDFKPTIDTVMQFAFICTDIEDAYCKTSEVTPRIMFDPTQWDISYELGPFWNENDVLQSMCGDNLNETWFYEDGTILHKEGMIVDEVGKERKERTYARSMYLALVYVIIGLFIVVFCAYIIVRQYVLYRVEEKEMMKRLLDDQEEDDLPTLYGTV